MPLKQILLSCNIKLRRLLYQARVKIKEMPISLYNCGLHPQLYSEIGENHTFALLPQTERQGAHSQTGNSLFIVTDYVLAQ